MRLAHRSPAASAEHPLVEQLDPVPHRPRRPARKMRLAADVRRRDHVRPLGLERDQLAAVELLRELGLQDRVGAGRAAAQVRIGDRQQLVADRAQHLLDAAAELHAVLQRARRMERDPLAAEVHRDLRRDPLPLGADHLDRVARELGDALRLLRVRRVLRQQMAVVLDHHAAAAGGDDDRLDAVGDARPPRVDVAPCERRAPRRARSGGAATRRSSRRRRRASAMMPMRSSTRAIAASMLGASEGCTQPSSTSMLRACRGGGHAPAGCDCRNAIARARAAAGPSSCVRAPARRRTAASRAAPSTARSALRAFRRAARRPARRRSRGRCRRAGRTRRPTDTSSRTRGRSGSGRGAAASSRSPARPRAPA